MTHLHAEMEGDEDSEDSEEEDGSSESGSGSGSGSGTESGSSEGESEGDEEEEEEEPVLKYRRFAKEVVGSITMPGMDQAVHIHCIAVHTRVREPSRWEEILSGSCALLGCAVVVEL